MDGNKTYALAMWAVLACAVVGCNSANNRANDSTGGEVKVDGSSTVYPITEAVAEEFSLQHRGVRVTVGASGTGGGMKKFAQGEIDICDASREIKELEHEKCAEAGIEVLEFSVAFDGLAVVVNPANDWCDCLTVEQLKTLWEPGSTISQWSDLNPAWPDEKIELYGPGTDSGTFDYFTEAIVGEGGASRPDYTASEDDNNLVIGVKGDPHALGYFGFAYYAQNADSLKVLAVDSGDGNCVEPSTDTVRTNTYKPLSRPLYIYVSKAALSRPAVANFVTFYLDNADQLAADVDYVPVSEEVAAENKQKLATALETVEAAAEPATAAF